jgi:hypothetical protein
VDEEQEKIENTHFNNASTFGKRWSQNINVKDDNFMPPSETLFEHDVGNYVSQNLLLDNH